MHGPLWPLTALSLWPRMDSVFPKVWVWSIVRDLSSSIPQESWGKQSTRDSPRHDLCSEHLADMRQVSDSPTHSSPAVGLPEKQGQNLGAGATREGLRSLTLHHVWGRLESLVDVGEVIV